MVTCWQKAVRAPTVSNTFFKPVVGLTGAPFTDEKTEDGEIWSCSVSQGWAQARSVGAQGPYAQPSSAPPANPGEQAFLLKQLPQSYFLDFFSGDRLLSQNFASVWFLQVIG